MLFNNDLLEVIADVELLGYIKKYDWPKTVRSFEYLISTNEDDFTLLQLHFDIVADSAKGVQEVPLWFAINDPRLSPYSYLNDLNLPLLYKNGFITDYTKFPLILQSAIVRKPPSIDALTIILSHFPDLYVDAFNKAIGYNNVEVIKWLYAVKPDVISATCAELIDKDRSVDVMEFYKSIYPDWLSDVNVGRIHTEVFKYNDGFRWLLKETGFDIRPSLIANDGELLLAMFVSAAGRYRMDEVRNILNHFTDIILSLSSERIESIVTTIYKKCSYKCFDEVMLVIPVDKIPANFIIEYTSYMNKLMNLCNSERIGGDYESVSD